MPEIERKKSTQQVITTLPELDEAIKEKIEILNVDMHEMQLQSSLTLEEMEKRLRKNGYEIREPIRSIDPMAIGPRKEFALWFKKTNNR